MTLESTLRLKLRPFRLDDLPLLYKLHSHPLVMERIPCGIRTKDETFIDLQEDIIHQEKHGFSKWAVFSKDTNEFIGRAGWAWMGKTGEAEVGFKFFPQYWGQGLATEVLGALLSWGQNHIPSPLIAFAFPENKASLRVMEKAGMIYLRQDVYEGKEIIVYGTGKRHPERSEGSPGGGTVPGSEIPHCVRDDVSRGY